MRVAVDISLYPLTGDYLNPIRAFIARLNDHPQLRVHTNSLSTQVWGSYDEVMSVLAAEIRAAAAGAPQLVFVMKVLPNLDAPPELEAPPEERAAGRQKNSASS